LTAWWFSIQKKKKSSLINDLLKKVESVFLALKEPTKTNKKSRNFEKIQNDQYLNNNFLI